MGDKKNIVCPPGAIWIEQIARVDPPRCKGCGRCVEALPQGAMRPHLAKRGYVEKRPAPLYETFLSCLFPKEVFQ